MDYGDGIFEWGNSLWMYHQKQKGNDCSESDSPFYAALNDNPTRAQALSSGAFIYTCYFLAFMPSFESKKPVSTAQAEFDAASADPGLFHKWRLSVFRNNYQTKYALLEQCLKDVLDHYGEDKAIELMPDHFFSLANSRGSFRNNLTELQFKTSVLSFDQVDQLLEKVQLQELTKQKKRPGNDLSP